MFNTISINYIKVFGLTKMIYPKTSISNTFKQISSLSIEKKNTHNRTQNSNVYVPPLGGSNKKKTNETVLVSSPTNSAQRGEITGGIKPATKVNDLPSTV